MYESVLPHDKLPPDSVLITVVTCYSSWFCGWTGRLFSWFHLGLLVWQHSAEKPLILGIFKPWRVSWEGQSLEGQSSFSLEVLHHFCPILLVKACPSALLEVRSRERDSVSWWKEQQSLIPKGGESGSMICWGIIILTVPYMMRPMPGRGRTPDFVLSHDSMLFKCPVGLSGILWVF